MEIGMKPRLLAVIVACCVVPAVANAGDLKGDLDKLLKDGSNRFGTLLKGKIDEALAEAQKGFVEAVLGITEKHLAEAKTKFDADLAARDKRIGELEGRLKSLEAKLAEAKAIDPWLQKELTGAFVGLGYTDLPDEQKKALKVEGGAVVTDLIAEGPAAAAGIQKGDVITAINGRGVSSTNFSSAVRTFAPGSKIKLTRIREGSAADVEVTLVDKDAFWKEKVQKLKPVVLGVRVTENDGLVVSDIEDGFTGAVAGLKDGDRLLKVNGADVKTLEEVSAKLQPVHAGDRLELSIQRGAQTIAVAVVAGNGKGDAKLLSSESSTRKGVLGLDVVPGDAGAVIEAVADGGTGAAYGLQKGDVIKKINAQDVTATAKLVEVVNGLTAGERISIVVARGDSEVTITDALVGAEGETVPAPPKPGRLGIVAEETEDGKIVVRSLEAGGAGEKSGLKVGDVLVSAGDRALKSFDDLAAVLTGKHAGDSIAFKVRRGDNESEAKVVLGE